MLCSAPEGVSGHRNLDSSKAVSTDPVGGGDLDPPLPPVDALPAFQVCGEIFNVRLPASAVGSELTQWETSLLDDQAGLAALSEEFGFNHCLVLPPGIQGEEQAPRRFALVQPTGALPTTGEAGPQDAS